MTGLGEAGYSLRRLPRSLVLGNGGGLGFAPLAAMTPPGILIVLGSPNDEHGNLHSLGVERCRRALRFSSDFGKYLKTICFVVFNDRNGY